jgi:hypothetical protein
MPWIPQARRLWHSACIAVICVGNPTMMTLTALRVAAVALSVFAVPAHAQDGLTCQASAAEKKLAGAARSSFLAKCERDAVAACEAAATEKKLSGAARTSFTRKCVRDAVGEPAVAADRKS